MAPSIPPRPSQPSSDQAGPPAKRPWRTEGLPTDPPTAPKNPEWNWGTLMLRALLIYGAVSLILTVQDRMNGPQAISYTESAAHVEAGNIAEVFARGHTSQGELREEKAIPDTKSKTDAGNYKRFSTERPVFAQDDLMARLVKSNATVRATPLVEERGLLANLLISFGPILLLVLFSFWLFRKQQSAMGGRLFGGKASKP